MKLLDSIVERCLDNNSDNRYKNIEEIKNEISKYNAQTKRKIILNEQIDESIDTEEIKRKINRCFR